MLRHERVEMNARAEGIIRAVAENQGAIARGGKQQLPSKGSPPENKQRSEGMAACGREGQEKGKERRDR